MGRGVCYLHSSVGKPRILMMSDGARSPLFTGPVGFVMHLYDVRWDAESAIYTASLAWPRISMMSDGARSPLFTRLCWLDHASV